MCKLAYGALHEAARDKQIRGYRAQLEERSDEIRRLKDEIKALRWIIFDGESASPPPPSQGGWGGGVPEDPFGSKRHGYIT